MKHIAVFTGASSGLGQEFVRRLDEARTFDEIWLIARREDRLQALAETLRSPARILALDLSLEDGLRAFEEALLREPVSIDVMVNAAGFGLFGTFSEMALPEQLGMIDLNAKALTALTYLTLPHMSSGSEFYQISSISAFQPVPYIAVYSATKAYVLSFTRAVAREIRHRGIRMMAVCPFWTKTAFFDRAVHDDTVSYYARFYTPEQVVARALRDMKRGKDVSVCGGASRAQVLMVKLLPHRLVMNVWCRQQKKK